MTTYSDYALLYWSARQHNRDCKASFYDVQDIRDLRSAAETLARCPFKRLRSIAARELPIVVVAPGRGA